jgi:hypothetical protein
MSFSRREFLKTLSIATLSAAGLSVGYLFGDAYLRNSTFLLDLIPDLDELDQADLDILALMVKPIFINYPEIDSGRYRVMYQTRAEEFSVIRKAYWQCAQSLRGRAEAKFQDKVENLTPIQRRELLMPELSQQVLERTEITSEQRAIQELVHITLVYFLSTDAYILVGYDGWPGEPRGFDSYQQARQANQ